MSLEQDGLFDPPAPPTVSQSRAAELCGVSTTTIRRYRQSGRLEGCEPDEESGGWKVPIPALIAAGLLKRSSPADTVTTERVERDKSPHEVTPQTALESRISELEAALAQAQQRAAVAEALASERDRTIAAQELALKALTTGPAADEEQPKKKRNWMFWQK